MESNSLLVKFIEDIFQYWSSGDKEFLRVHLPDEVYEQVVNSGEYFDGMHKAFKYFFTKINNNPLNFLEWDKEKVDKELRHVKGVNDRDQERIQIMIRIYQLIYKKYYPQYIDLLKDLESVNAFPQADIASLKRSLDIKELLPEHYDYLEIFIHIESNEFFLPRRRSFMKIYTTKDTSRRAFHPCTEPTMRRNLRPSVYR